MSKIKTQVVIGSGAGYSGDRIEPAEELVKSGKLDYIGFECLAERTIALAQLKKLKDPQAGYDPLLVERMERILPLCREKGVKLITNMGAANPKAALEKTLEIARKHNLKGLKIAAVIGDDVSKQVADINPLLLETGKPLLESIPEFVSANVYLGVESILPALQAGADVVITGRVADPALFLAPLVHEFGWVMNDWNLLGKGTVVGHLLECAGQITGGYYAEPGKKNVPNLARLGFPMAEVSADGNAVITKLSTEGGKVDLSTCKEQLLYELHNPSAYLTPDVTADFSGVRFEQSGIDRVQVTGGKGTQRPDQLKVCIGYHGGYIGEGSIGYAGPGSKKRARLAAEIVKERLSLVGVRFSEIRFDLLGVDSLHRAASPGDEFEPYEVIMRVAAKTDSLKVAQQIGNEVETLYTNGPAGGGGAVKGTREIVAVASTLIPREMVTPVIIVTEVD
ncbi:DUF1446 domain-containing protein [bacterium]|nr:DUF1446 domain-containing protein [bacterium]